MSNLNETPSSDRIHIGFFGLRNAGKSSLVNAICGQGLSVVSDTPGTTTDAVKKSMELLPLGPVVIVDTPGLDDSGSLGELRVKAARRVLATVDIAVVVSSAKFGLCKEERELIEIIKQNKTPYLVVYNKCDVEKNTERCGEDALFVSAKGRLGIEELKAALGKFMPDRSAGMPLIGDLIRPSDFVVLVTPIDNAAPKGRLILPQQQVLRGILDTGALAAVTRETEYSELLDKLGTEPNLVVTDSQVFKSISEKTPDNIPLTSFSILMARYKGFLEIAARGAKTINLLKDGDTVLIAEGCTHHRQCGDIATVKIPALLKKFTGADLKIVTSSGKEFPEDLSGISLVIHCGGCMLTSRDVLFRMKICEAEGVPVTNFGIALAYMNGILERTTRMIPELKTLF